LLQPNFTSSAYFAGPFAVISQPSELMVLYGLLYAGGFLLLALFSFSYRDL
jgi:hypothetical protein